MRPNGLSTRESLKSRKVEERCDEACGVCLCHVRACSRDERAVCFAVLVNDE